MTLSEGWNLECADMNSKICLACKMAKNDDDRVLCHLAHLEIDHGLKVIQDEQGRFKLNSFLEEWGVIK